MNGAASTSAAETAAARTKRAGRNRGAGGSSMATDRTRAGPALEAIGPADQVSKRSAGAPRGAPPPKRSGARAPRAPAPGGAGDEVPRTLNEARQGDVERALPACAAMPLHEDRALVGAFDDRAAAGRLPIGDEQADRALHAQETRRR